MGRLAPGELPITPHDKVVAYLPIWSEYREKYRRSEGLDHNINNSWKVISERMDTLIEAMMRDIIIVTPVEIDYAEAITQELEVVKPQQTCGGELDGRGTQ